MRGLIWGALLAGVSVAGAQAQELDGAGLYEHYCATCHGLEADGRGPMAPVLVVQPVNLTELAARNGGTFPTALVVARIDGQDPLVSHGSAMPVFGPFFEGKGIEIKDENGKTIDTSAPIAALVAYLKTIQKSQ